MQFAIGPWQWIVESGEDRDGPWSIASWNPPAGSIGCIDLRPVSEQVLRGTFGDRPHSVFVFPAGFPVPSGYEILTADQRGRDAWQSLIGTRVEGDTVERLILNHRLAGDPLGLDRSKPAMPGHDGILRQHLGPQTHAEPFRFGLHPHTERVRDTVRRLLADDLAATQSREDIDAVRREMDWWCDKFKLRTDNDEWQELVQPELRSELTPLRHETSWSESWPDNTGTLADDQDQPWTIVSGNAQVRFISPNTNLTVVDANSSGNVRCETQLSGADHLCRCLISGASSITSRRSGPAVRYQAAADTFYWAAQAGGGSGTGIFRPAKVVAGTLTNLGGTTSVTIDRVKECRISGDSLSIYHDSSGTATDTVTDDTITGGTRQGSSFVNCTNAVLVQRQNYAEDLAPSGDPPVNTVPPLVTGSTTEGGTLSSTNGTWTGTETITYTYQWFSADNSSGNDPEPISGATLSTYSSLAADVGNWIACRVTATNDFGSESEFSNWVGPIGSGDTDREAAGTLTLPALTLSGSVEATVPQYEASGELTLPPLSLTSAVEAQVPTYEVTSTLVLTALTLSGEATRTLPEGSVVGALVLPAITLSGAVEATVPKYDVSGTLTLPPLQLSGEVDRTLPEGAVVGSLTLPSLVLSGLVEAEVPVFDTVGTLVLPAIQIAGTVATEVPGAEASGTLVLPALTLSGTVVVGVVPEPPVEPGAVPWQYWWWIGQGGGVFESPVGTGTNFIPLRGDSGTLYPGIRGDSLSTFPKLRG